MTAAMKIRVRKKKEGQKRRLKKRQRGKMVQVENWLLFLRRTWRKRKRRGERKTAGRKRRWRMKMVKSSAFQTRPSPSLIYSRAGNFTTAATSNKRCHCTWPWGYLMKSSLLIPRSAQNPGFKKEVTAQVMIAIRPHTLRQFHQVKSCWRSFIHFSSGWGRLTGEETHDCKAEKVNEWNKIHNHLLPPKLIPQT